MNILITGAAGFIASRLALKLHNEGGNKLYLVDDFSPESKKTNWENLVHAEHIDRIDFLNAIESNSLDIDLDWIIHLGARTDTTEMDYAVHEKWNLNYSKSVWNYCVKNQVSLEYASSAATYGDGSLGYKDDMELADKLQPLNPYGVSKNEFDKWVNQQSSTPPHWYGLKFFNVYGPQESHKGRMASVVYHAYGQIKDGGSLTLFRSHNPEYKDGEQMRDFVFVDDVVDVIVWLMRNTPESGIYNLGSGQARSFLDLAEAIFNALGQDANIAWRDTPEDIRDKYQYYTQADMTKLKSAGYPNRFHSLEDGVANYIDYLEGQI